MNALLVLRSYIRSLPENRQTIKSLAWTARLAEEITHSEFLAISALVRELCQPHLNELVWLRMEVLNGSLPYPSDFRAYQIRWLDHLHQTTKNEAA